MVLGVRLGRKNDNAVRMGLPRVLRVIVDGRELLVRKLIRITPEEVVYVDFSGHVRVMRRGVGRRKKFFPTGI